MLQNDDRSLLTGHKAPRLVARSSVRTVALLASVSAAVLGMTLSQAKAQTISGTTIVSGPGAFMDFPLQLFIGDNRAGTLIIENGGYAQTMDGITVGPFTGAATLIVRGAGSYLNVNTDIDMGRLTSSVSTISVENGAVIESTSVNLVRGSSTLNLTGTSDAPGTLYTSQISKSSGTGTFNIDGGLIKAQYHRGDFIRGFGAGEITIGSKGATFDSNGYDIGVNSSLGGTGGLRKISNGTLTLGAANTYAGPTAVLQGILKAGATGAFANGSAFTVDASGTLDLNGTRQTIGSLAGSGLVTNSGGAVSTLTTGGDNNSTTFGGILQDGTSGLELIKTGSGTLALTGTSTLSGPTIVEAGRLAVNGSLANSAVTVQSAGTLGGTGTVGSILTTANGTVAPGNAIGTLTVAGNVSFASGSIYQVEANAVGQADRIVATGTAILNGGTVQVLAESGTYQPSTTYTILTADGGVSGTFSAVTSNFAFLTPSLGYDAKAVNLTLVRKTEPQPPTPQPPEPQPPTPQPVAFHVVAVTGNQFRVADAVEALGSGNRLFDVVIGQSAAGARQAFDALSGEAHAAAGTTTIGSAGLVQNTLLSRLRSESVPTSAQGQGTYSAAYAADGPGAAPEPEMIAVSAFDPYHFALWGEGLGSWGKVDDSATAAGLDTSTGGFILGAEANIDQTYRVGLAGGFIRTTFDAAARLSSGSNESIFGALYGSAAWGRLNLRLGTSLSAHDIDTQRTVLFPGFNETVGAAYSGWTAQAFGELGYRFDLARVQLEPFVGASILRLHTDAFQESGGASVLTGFAQDQNLGTTTLGLRAEARLSDQVPLIARGLLGWRHAYGDVSPTALLAFADGTSTFTVAGTPVDRNALVAEAGLEWQASQAASLGVAYQGQIGSQAQEHALKGSFVWRFGTY